MNNIPGVVNHEARDSKSLAYHIPENDKLFVWMIVKNLDHPRSKMIPLLDDLGITIYDRDGEYPYIRRSDFRNLLYTVAAKA